MCRRVVVWFAGLVIAVGAASAQPADPVEQARARLHAEHEHFNSKDPSDAKTVAGFLHAAGEGRLDLVKLYVTAGIDVNARAKTRIQSTALLDSIKRIHPNVAAYLLSRGADPNLANKDGVSPLQLAIRASLFNGWRKGYRDLIAELIAKGANVNGRDKTGTTPLIEAGLAGNAEVAVTLLDKGARLEERNDAGETALLVASRTSARFASVMLELRANPNATNATGRTPLMQAVKHGWLTVVEPALMDYFPEYIRLLVDKGADVNATDLQGRTALAEAVENGDRGTTKLLLERGARPTRVAFEAAVEHRQGPIIRTFIDLDYPLTAAQRFKYIASRIAFGLAWAFPLMIIATIIGLVRYSNTIRKRPKLAKHDAAQGDQLPRLAPIKCASCGAGVPVKLEGMQCAHCHTPATAPEDYKETLTARAEAEVALRQAVVQWRRADLMTRAPVRWFFWSLGFVWLAVINVGVFNELGRGLFSGHPWLFISGMLGAVGLPFVSIAYSAYLGDVKKRLPVVPKIGKHVAAGEVASCATCGGTIAYAAGELVTPCGYCGTETYRVELARRSRIAARKDSSKAALSLYEAMVEVDALRHKLLDNLIMAPMMLPALLYFAPIATLVVLGLLALLGSC